tara:strand:- start:107 stop:292 length:186 start_codon:yes stop_codon:yes gene_type:complete
MIQNFPEERFLSVIWVKPLQAKVLNGKKLNNLNFTIEKLKTKVKDCLEILKILLKPRKLHL